MLFDRSKLPTGKSKFEALVHTQTQPSITIDQVDVDEEVEPNNPPVIDLEGSTSTPPSKRVTRSHPEPITIEQIQSMYDTKLPPPALRNRPCILIFDSLQLKKPRIPQQIRLYLTQVWSTMIVM